MGLKRLLTMPRHLVGLLWATQRMERRGEQWLGPADREAGGRVLAGASQCTSRWWEPVPFVLLQPRIQSKIQFISFVGGMCQGMTPHPKESSARMH